MNEKESIERALRFSRKGLALPWLDADGEPVPEFAKAFAVAYGPRAEPLGADKALVIARAIWDEMDEKERQIGLPIMQVPDRAKAWIFAGVTATGVAPEFEPWRTAQRQLKLATLLGKPWRVSEEIGLEKLPHLRQALGERKLSGFAKLCVSVSQKVELLGKGKAPERFASGIGAHHFLNLAPLAVVAVLWPLDHFVLGGGFNSIPTLFYSIGGAGMAGRFALRLATGKGVSIFPWTVARFKMPALGLKSKKDAEQKAAAGWAVCGGLSDVKGLEKVSLRIGSRHRHNTPLAEIFEEETRVNPLAKEKETAAQAFVGRLDDTLSLGAFIAREESEQMRALLDRSKDNSGVAAPTKPRKARSL